MRRSWLVGSVTMMAGLLAGAVPALQAQTAAVDPRDFSGVWRLSKAAGPPWKPNSNRQFASEVPLQAWAREHCKEIGCARAVNSAGEAVGDAYFQGKDPALIRCAPYGFPRMMIDADQMEIFETRQRDRIFMRFYRNNHQREIWMDGRRHPEDPQRPWTGHSIGRWDGDTLVVDTMGLTAGQNGKYKWLDGAGFPHSDELHVVERIRRVSRNTLQVDLTFEDPKTFRTPIRSTLNYTLNEDKASLAYNGPSVEYIQCEDRIYAEGETEAWPYVSSDYDYKPQFPPAGTALYESGE
ncbi:MAG: hypothetical protein ACRD88_14520 [Terriglobia bacterium]